MVCGKINLNPIFEQSSISLETLELEGLHVHPLPSLHYPNLHTLKIVDVKCESSLLKKFEHCALESLNLKCNRDFYIPRLLELNSESLKELFLKTYFAA